MAPIPNGKTAVDMLLDQMTHVRDGQDDLRQDFADHRVMIEHRLTSVETKALHKAKGAAAWISIVISALVTALAALIGLPRAS